MDRLPRWQRHASSLGIVVTGAALLAFILENVRVPAQIDDAYIFYRYARNLLEGHGLVFNPGERVEGVTSLAWVFLVAGFLRTGLAAETAGHLLGVLSGLALLALTYAYACTGESSRNRPVLALAPWLLLLTSCFAVWSTAGLESPLFAAGVLSVLVLEARRKVGLAIAATAVTTLVRPEGMALAAVLFSHLAMRRVRPPRYIWLAGAAYALLVLLLTAFRLSYFGAPLPNTFYAKAGGAVWWWQSYYVVAFMAQLAAPLLPASWLARKDPEMRLGIAWTLATLGYVTVLGGDAFMYSRLFLHIVPVLCALALRGACRVAPSTPVAKFRRASIGVAASWFLFGPVPGLAAAAALGAAIGFRARRTGLRAATVAAALATFPLALVFNDRVVQRSESKATPGAVWRSVLTGSRSYELSEHQRYAALAVTGSRSMSDIVTRRHPTRDAVVAALGIGVLGYAYPGKVIDLLGLVDPVIARTDPKGKFKGLAIPGHARSNAEYVLSRKPDYILIPKRRTAGPVNMRAVQDLWRSRAFQRQYWWNPVLGGYVRRMELMRVERR